MRSVILFAICAVIGGMATHQYLEWQRLNSVMERFISAGPRFTANDGQILCLRIRELERKTNLPVSDCHYSK